VGSILDKSICNTAFPEDYISGGATMKGYILPHKSKIDDETYKYAEGLNGWNSQQGFYVYRGKRLLLAVNGSAYSERKNIISSQE
jgi:hypothetical protein